MWNAAALTPEAFRALLRWLDEGVDSGGEQYLGMRRRLVAYFDRKRCAAPEDLADETLNRVARRLQETAVAIEGPPAQYCYITARYVFLEWLRSPDRRVDGGNDVLATGAPATALPDSSGTDAARLLWLEECLDELSASDKELILEYYEGGSKERIKRRRALASRLRLTPNALAIRASRIRAALESCVTRRAGHDRFAGDSSYRE